MKQKQQQSEFNDAIGYLTQINALFFACTQAKFEKDPIMWFDSLTGLFSALSTWIDEKDIIDYELELKRIGNICYSKKEQREDGISTELFWFMMKFELKMRKITKVSGLQTKLKEFDPHAAI